VLIAADRAGQQLDSGPQARLCTLRLVARPHGTEKAMTSAPDILDRRAHSAAIRFGAAALPLGVLSAMP
jgi:hypothetical protein